MDNSPVTQKKGEKGETSKPSWMHSAKLGTSLSRAQLDLQEASTEACSTPPESGFGFFLGRRNMHTRSNDYNLKERGSMRVCPYRLLRPV